VRIARRVPRRAAVPAVTLAIALFASVLSGGPAPAAASCTSPPAVFPESSLTPGMTATGLTTISGTTPTSFTIEILGVIPNGFMLGTDAIVGRVIGPASFLVQTGGGFEGMSGSPVSIGGKLVGVVSFGYYADPSIVGLTPGSAVVDLLGFAGTGAAPSRIPFTPDIRRAVARSLGQPTSQVTGGLEPFRVPVGVSGLSAGDLAKLQHRLDRHASGTQVFPSGSAAAPTAASATPFSPGQPIGSVIAYGDATIWAMGTASIVCGDVVAAYGHSLFWSPPGSTSLGMTGANVLTVMSSPVYGGSMLGYVTDTRGTFTQDRYAGQVGIFGTLPATAAITSELSSPDTGISRDGRTDVVYQQGYWFPDTAWSHLYGNLAAVFQRSGDGTSNLSWTIEGVTEQGTPFTVTNRGMFWSDYDASITVNKVASSLYALAYNRFAPVTFTSLDVAGSITSERLEGRISRIRTSTSLQPGLRSRNVTDVRPGGRVTIEVTLTPVEGSGPEHVATFTIRMPRSAHGLKWIGLSGGRDRTYMSDQGAGSFEDLLWILGGGTHRNDLIVSGPFGRSSFEQDVIVKGRGSVGLRIGR
jgi:hypothetical protein